MLLYKINALPHSNGCPGEHFRIVTSTKIYDLLNAELFSFCCDDFDFGIYISAPKPTQGSCIDDPTQSCSTLASVVNICSTPHRAKGICRKYCRLCGMGKIFIHFRICCPQRDAFLCIQT